MKRFLLAVALLAATLTCFGAEAEVTPPFEIDARPTAKNPLDAIVLAALHEKGIEPAYLCSDAVFVRRVHIDLLGALPNPWVVRLFLANESPDKRAELIDFLLESEGFVDYCSLKWCDLLRVKAEFPIKLWPNGVQAYHRWIRQSIVENRPYDEFVRDLLTSSGSNFRVPPVNFYLAVQDSKPATIADAAALTFMGVQTKNWPEAKRSGMAAFFSRLAFKPTAEWKETIVCQDPAPAEAIAAVFADGHRVIIAPDEDPRQVFADWLITPENPWFTRNIANRVWSWLLGRGIIDEADDIRPDNPPSNPELLAYLEKELVASDYDLRHLYRIILNSGTYQQSSIPRSDDPQAEALFAHYKVRRLDAEVLIDALSWIGGDGENYTSVIPEPFTFIPKSHPTVALADGSITSQFLEMFGRPTRDTGLESERNNKVTVGQRLHLLNSTNVRKKIRNSRRIRGLSNLARKEPGRALNALYVLILSRMPTPEEIAAAEEYAETSGGSMSNVVEDLFWALINSKEFLYRH